MRPGGWHHTEVARRRISEASCARQADRPHLPGLKQMKAAAKPGECIACGEPAVPLSDKASARYVRKHRGTTRTHRDTCGAPECKTAWFRFWRRDQREGA